MNCLHSSGLHGEWIFWVISRYCTQFQKSCGYHLDLFWVGVLMAVCSFMGMPWYVAATVISIAHIDSLKMESESSAPGEQPQFLGVRWDPPPPRKKKLTIIPSSAWCSEPLHAHRLVIYQLGDKVGGINSIKCIFGTRGVSPAGVRKA